MWFNIPTLHKQLKIIKISNTLWCVTERISGELSPCSLTEDPVQQAVPFPVYAGTYASIKNVVPAIPLAVILHQSRTLTVLTANLARK